MGGGLEISRERLTAPITKVSPKEAVLVERERERERDR